LYLIIQAIISVGVGGYIAGRTRTASAASHVSEIEHRDGLHGLAAWALAVVLGTLLAAFISSAALTRSNASLPAARTSAAEPLLSYELDRLFRPARRAANIDLAPERAEAGRILLTSSSHSGMANDDRAYLAQMVAATTGLAPPDAEKRTDMAIANAQTAIARSRSLSPFRSPRLFSSARWLHGPRQQPEVVIVMEPLCRVGSASNLMSIIKIGRRNKDPMGEPLSAEAVLVALSSM
jgi:hypothetical protein